MGSFEDSTVEPESSKTLCDSVHGHITLHPAWVLIIDTPQFQRLRSIRQTGFCDYVFPGATHNRFGHSIGVAFLAGCFIRQIRDTQPDLKITATEVLCVEIAGLCHDLGHGPFSHTWELYMKAETANRKVSSAWKHEDVSLNMLDFLIDTNCLKPLLQQWDIGDNEIDLIKKMILGDTNEEAERSFLYQIVNNKESGLDVDKWDYFLRDVHHCGVQCTFDYKRLLLFARVKSVAGHWKICFRDKEASTVLNMFRTRSLLHHQVYQHRVCRLIETIFLKSLSLANGPESEAELNSLKFFEWSMDAMETNILDSQFHNRMSNFSSLTDLSVLSFIMFYASSSAVLKESRMLINSFFDGRQFKTLFKFIGEVTLDNVLAEDEVLAGIVKHLPQVVNEDRQQGQSTNGIQLEDFKKSLMVQVSVMDWGKGLKNPIDSVYFYSKKLGVSAQPWSETKKFLDFPCTFQEVQARVYCQPAVKESVTNLAFKCLLKYQKELISQGVE